MPSNSPTKGMLPLIVGDLIAYIFSLILTLTIRYRAIPGQALLAIHLSSFSILFIIFLLVSFSAGLYDREAAIIRGKIYSLLARVQALNVVIGIIFFYFAPVSIAPKANLLIFFIISTTFLYLWRIVMYPVVSITRRRGAIMVGVGEDVQDLVDEVNSSHRYSLVFRETVAPKSSAEDTASAINAAVQNTGATIIVADLHNPAVEATMPFLYSLIFAGIQVIDGSRLYESVFDRIPLSMVGERWLVENSSTALGTRRIYDIIKRVMDIILASILGVISLLVYPFVYLAIKLDDGNGMFVTQKRVGKNGMPIDIAKFRSMTSNDAGVYGANGKSEQKVTRVGHVIRLTRVDELPQLWSVIKGEQSLIGPRPELPALVKVYEKEIPYYNVRNLIKPGLSGWAQIYHRAHPHHAVAVDDTRDKLSYDLFYVKNRSLTLDLRIFLQTLRALLSRQGV